MYGEALPIRGRYSHQRLDGRLSQYRREAIKGIPLNTSKMGEGRVLQKYIWSVKVRRFAQPNLGHRKDYEVLPGVTGLESTVTSLHVCLRKTQAQVLGIK